MKGKAPQKAESKIDGKIYLVVIVAIVFAVAGFFTGKFIQGTSSENENNQETEDHLTELRGGGYRYINPLLECDNYRSSKGTKVTILQQKVQEYINEKLNERSASIISIYFRDLNNGPWIGINENENYSPASLLKVPVLIAVLKKAESDQGLLSRKILYERPVDEFTQNIDDKQMIQTGNSYTVEDLLRRMIEHSDNEAKNLMFMQIGDEFFNKVVTDLGLFIPGYVTENFMSVRSYSSFFRILYNATYLNRELSEKALEILSTTNYKDGIVSGLPKGVVVSHKFGERGYADSNVKQLHDCGIVYPPSGAPYLLCVMTRGTDFKTQAKIIGDISSIVYKELTETGQ
ncbi:MAG: serine hydrolase [Chitinophagales bacterium]|nr:serine hydrolase [Chitinophagales bacterium]